MVHIKNPVEWLFSQLEATVGYAPDHPDVYWPATRAESGPQVERISTADLKYALRRGLHDFSAARSDVFLVAIIYPAAAALIAAAEAHGELLPLLFPVASGFALLGPLLAVGLYEMSRDRELTGEISIFDIAKVLRAPSIGAILGLGALMIAVFLIWLAAAAQIYDFTLGPLPPVSTGAFFVDALTTPAGWVMIVLGSAVGALFAALSLAISVVSFPLLLDRPVGFGVAIATSLTAFRHNFVPLSAWGLFVAVALVAGALPCLVGLIVVLPVLGHATWHLYRQIVRPPAGLRGLNPN
jgi:uncharacterized membrane protein